MFFSRKKPRMPAEEAALPGREAPMPVPARHAVKDAPLAPPFPDGMEQAVFGMGCFWGAERKFWEADGVYTTAVGYAGGFTPNPTYEDAAGFGAITTEIREAPEFYYAEDYHQQYLHKVPNGYCGIGGTGVSCPRRPHRRRLTRARWIAVSDIQPAPDRTLAVWLDLALD